MYGHFSGINRKVQLKYQAKGKSKSSTSSPEEESNKDPSLLLILKWGGELTPTGRVQAEELGKVFRCMYPGGQGGTITNKSGLSKIVSSDNISEKQLDQDILREGLCCITLSLCHDLAASQTFCRNRRI